MIGFALQCVSLLASRSPRTLVLAVIAALALAAVCWWVCTNYYRLWNNQFQVRSFHLALCALAAVMTLMFTVVAVSLRYAGDAASIAVNSWRRSAAPRLPVDGAIRQTPAVFGRAVAADFERTHPFLAGFLEVAGPRIPVRDDMMRWSSERPGEPYPAKRGFDAAAGGLRDDLIEQTPALTRRVRIWALALFAAFQAVPFILTGWSAYRGLREQT